MRAFLTDEFKADLKAVATFELQLLVFLKIGDRQRCREFIGQLSGAGVSLVGLDAAHANAIDVLASRKELVLRPDSGAFTVFAITTDTLATLARSPDGQRYKLSRFAYLTSEQGTLIIRNPLSDRYIAIHDPAIVAMFGNFAQPCTIEAAARTVDNPDNLDDARAFADVLAAGAMLLPCDDDGHTQDDRDLPRRMWEFHDLLLHSRSRIGRTGGPIGGTYAFSDIPEPSPAIGFAAEIGWIALPADTGVGSDITLFDAMARRRSVRSFTAAPLDIAQLAQFLQRSVGRLPAGPMDDGQIRRPYPSGGALYEQRFYIAVDRVAGLERGLYVYDEVRSRLGLVAGPCAKVDTLLDDAGRTVGTSARPPALIVITSRFGRVRWKYSGLAYALQLKHVGVIQEAMYLTATALGLGGCALGSGDTDAFGTLAGLEYLEEGALGEFVLGIPALQ